MELRQYQIDIAAMIYDRLTAHKICYLAAEVRTGKTLMALTAANMLGVNRVLFITKKKAINSIENDYSLGHWSFDLKVTNYESLHKLDYIADLVIVDESHSLGSYPVPSLRTKLIKGIVGRKPLLLLSGTPSPESYSQLYHQFWVSDNSPFKEYHNFYKWSKEFVKVKQKMINGHMINDYSRADKVKIDKMTNHLFISFSQKDAGFENEVNEEIIKIPIDKNIYDLANILMNRRYYRMKDGSEIVCDTAAKLKTKLHQIYSGTVITESGELKLLDRSKADYIFSKYAGKKIAIFYLFQAEGNLLREVFPFNTDSPEEFNKQKNLVFISQIQSGSMGTNLSSADVIVFYNIHYSSLLYWQARARSQHMNKKEDSKIDWIFSENGIENDVYKAVVKKKNYTTSYFQRSYLR